MKSSLRLVVRRADRLVLVVAHFLIVGALASQVCFAEYSPPWLLVPVGFRGGDGPTAGVEFLSPEVLKLRTGAVEGTHVSRLFTEPRDRYWNVLTGERLGGDLFNAMEPKVFDIDPELGRALVAGDLTAARLVDMKSGEAIHETDFDGPVLECHFIEGTALAVAFVRVGQIRRAIAFDPVSGATVWSDSDSDFRVVYRYIAEASKVVKQRPYYTAPAGETVSLVLREAATGMVVGELEEVVHQVGAMRSLRRSELPLLAGVRSGAGVQRIMNLATGAVFEVSPLAGGALYVELSHDRKRFALFDAENSRLTTHDAETGELLADLSASRLANGYDSGITWFDFSSGADNLLISDVRPSLTEWQTENGALVHSTPMLDGAGAAFVLGTADDGFVVISNNGRISIRDIDTGEKWAELGEVRFAPSIAFSPEGTRLALAEPGGWTRVYAYPSGEELLGLPAKQGLAMASGYVAATDSFLICYHNGAVDELDARTFELLRSTRLPNSSGDAVVIDSVGGRLLLTQAAAGVRTTVLYDPFSSESVPLGSPPIEYFSAADLASVEEGVVIALSRSTFAAGVLKHYAEVYDESGVRKQSVEIGFEATLVRLAATSGIVAYSVDDDQTFPGSSPFGFMDIETGVVVQPENLPGRLADLQFEPSGRVCLALWNEGGVSLRLSRIDATTGETLGEPLTIANSVFESGWFLGRLTLLPDGKRAVISTVDSRLIVVDLDTGETLVEKRARPNPTQVYDILPRLQQVSVSVGGERLLVQDAQGLIDAWLAGRAEAISLSVLPSPSGSMLSFETFAGFEYLIEQSTDLKAWRTLDLVDGDAAAVGEVILPLEIDGAAFARGFRFGAFEGSPNP